METRRWSAGALAATALLAIAACGGGNDGGAGNASGDVRGQSITAWTNEFQPDRLRKTQRILTDFTQKTGVRVKLVAIPEDQLSTLITSASAAGKLPDVVMATSMADSHAYAKQDVFDADAAQEVVDRLGPGTFSKRALDLVSADGKATGVPSDGWGQLLIYRKDLFDKAGLAAPKTLEDIRAAAQKLDQGRVAGITLATAPGDGFTAETFEHVALAEGCRLVDGGGKVTFDSPPCVEALRYYGDLAKRYSVAGNQDVDSTRATYFAGRAAMMFWSPFLLDGMAGLRDDTKPSCPECKGDPAFLAKNSGLIGPIAGKGEPSQFGSVSTFNISVDAKKAAAQKLVEFMMTDGYTRWIGLSPQGKFPVRSGDATDPQRFVKAWAKLDSGVDRTAPLSDFYSKDSIDSLREGVQSFQRWGFAQGQGALVGALSGEQPVAKAVAAVIGGKDPAQAAKDAQGQIEEIRAGLE
ncbi:MAG: multiple sugar transport system substrate-binding protein [Solirubrobacteraceae bacterium]|nr:multiple sugar transport system substrate-binding protein [Solirubrobacteraceae bacterium]